MRIEDEHPDVLQNIEFVVAQFYLDHPETTDYTVLRVYEALIDFCAAENIGRPPRPRKPSEAEAELFNQAKEMCEWWLGRNPGLLTESGEPAPPPRELDLATLHQCLKRLRKSLQKWTKHGGRQGYLQYMSRFSL